MSRLTGKVAVVTGGGAGIGKATCLLFAEEGASVVIAEQNETTGAQVAAEISASGGTALFVPTDVSDESSVKSMVAVAVGKFGTIHVLVNNAAVFLQKGLDASVEDWRKNFDVNVIGLALVSKHVVPEMRRAGGGAIVNLASISAFIAQPNLMTYNATKGAIVAVTRCMALDLAPDKIRVNAVCPGVTYTEHMQERLEREVGLGREQADEHPDWGGMHILHRIADPREIAYPIVFLVSDEASFITAESLMVDGGYVAK